MKNLTATICLTIAILVGLSGSIARSQAFGSFSCGQIIAWERNNNTLQIDAITMWFGGYIVGKNETAKVRKFANTDAPTLFYLLVKECKKTPTLSNGSAASIIYNK
jgi:hypothetical protein